MSATEDLKKHGIKITDARKTVLEFLQSNIPGHFSAEEIHKKLSIDHDFGIATIYRTLTQLESVRLIIRHSFADGLSVYEANHDEHHDHAVCLTCGKVIEFRDEDVAQRHQDIAKKIGFEPVRHNYVLYGYCQKSCYPDTED